MGEGHKTQLASLQNLLSRYKAKIDFFSKIKEEQKKTRERKN